MPCSTPQLLFDGGVAACSCCDGCRLARREADLRRRRFRAYRRGSGPVRRFE